MMIMSKVLTGAAGLAMVAGAAAPAAAQSYPYNGYGNNSGGNAVGQLINQVLGGGRYGQYGQGNDRVAVDQCARAAEARTSRAAYNGYNQGYNGQGYNQGYGNNGYNHAGAARVVGITSVERRSNGLKVSGVMASGNQGLLQPGLRQPGLWQQRPGRRPAVQLPGRLSRLCEQRRYQAQHPGVPPRLLSPVHRRSTDARCPDRRRAFFWVTS